MVLLSLLTGVYDVINHHVESNCQKQASCVDPDQRPDTTNLWTAQLAPSQRFRPDESQLKAFKSLRVKSVVSCE